MARATARLRATVWGELTAEFLGTLVLIAFGDGVVAMRPPLLGATDDDIAIR